MAEGAQQGSLSLVSIIACRRLQSCLSEVTLLLIVRFFIKQCSLQASAQRSRRGRDAYKRQPGHPCDVSQEELRPFTQISTPSPQPSFRGSVYLPTYLPI